MMTLLMAVAVLAVGWWCLKQVSTTNPAMLARRIKQAGGVAALGVGGLLLFRGRLDMAMFAGATAAWLFGWSHPRLPGFRRAGPSPGGRSQVRSATLEMELDHDSGDLSGRVVSGPLAGRALADLGEADLVSLRRDNLSVDPDGARLLEAYLDRRFPRWREHAEGDGHAGPGPDPQRGRMSEQEAYEILGLQPGAPTDEVRRAHRSLMKRLHPDQGGSTYLASRVNQAKDVLVDRHR